MSVYRGDDAEAFENAVESVAHQQLQDDTSIRIYLGVDGPIPPELDSAIQRMHKHLYKVLRFPTNRGLAHVLNDLIRNREDEPFFFRMDADDLSLPTRFARQLTYLFDNPDVDILGTAMLEWDTRSQTSRVVKFAEGPIQARRKIALRVPVAHPTVCFRARVFDRVPGYPLVSLNEDVCMWFACLRAGMSFDNLAEPLYRFRVNEQFWSRRGLRKAFLEFRSYIQGLWSLEGLSWRYIFPTMRLALRMAPEPVQSYLYGSRFRNL